MTTVALKYCDYLIERIAAVGDTAIAALDLSETTTHYWSGGACEPIEDAGQGPLYRLIEVDVPDWLIAGVVRGQADGRWADGCDALTWAARLAIGERATGWADALRLLITKRGKFADSLRAWFATHGYLTDKQANACERW